MKKSIALVGMMGSGKSAAGRALAAQLGLPFCDTDDMAAQAAGGRSPACIIAEEGESVFRRYESAALADALAGQRGVIATGGGVVLSADNRAALAADACVVYLRASVALLAARLRQAGQAAARPLLGKDAALEQRLAQLLAAREALYEKAADYAVVQSEGESPAAVAQKIAAVVAAG